MWPERSLIATGPWALWDDFVALAGTAYLILAAFGTGRWLLRRSAYIAKDLNPLEQAIFSPSIGLGLISLAIFALGCIGILKPAYVIGLVGVALTAFYGDWRAGLVYFRTTIGRARPRWRSLPPFGKSAVVIVGAIFALNVVYALTPAWSYDALMYHLPAPRIYLTSGRLVLLPDLWQANGPMSVEMLYAYALSLGSANIAKLTHLTYAVLLILATFAFARRFLDVRLACLSALVVTAVPIFPIWGSIANIDMAWAVYSSWACTPC